MNSIPPIIAAVSSCPVTAYAITAVVKVAVIRQLKALAKLLVRESGVFKAVRIDITIAQPSLYLFASGKELIRRVRYELIN